MNTSGMGRNHNNFNFSKPALKQSDYADVLFGFTICVAFRFLCAPFVTGFTWLSCFESVYVEFFLVYITTGLCSKTVNYFLLLSQYVTQEETREVRSV